MISQLLKDSIEHPRLFVWRGPLDPAKLQTWRSSSAFVIPVELQQLWMTTGGGDIFETETVLSPLTDDPEFDIEATNDFYWRSGLPKTLFIFHIGMWISALSNESRSIRCLQPGSLVERENFADTHAWYVEGIRKEYAARYGLKPPIHEP